MSFKNPFNRKTEYGTFKRPVKRYSNSTADMGFLATAEEEILRLEKDVLGLGARLKYKYDHGVPAAYVGERIFTPSTDIIDVDIEQNGAAAEPCNMVVPSGEEFSIPIILQGPGVFRARYMSVTLYQRYFFNNGANTTNVQWIPIPVGKPFFNTDPTSGVGTQIQSVKRSIMYNILGGFLADNQGDRLYGANFFWNFVDEDSQRRLADDWLPDQCLRPQGYQLQQDGGVYQFRTDWLFERANTVSLRLRMINDIMQLDPTSATFPFLGLNDLENGQRNQSVKVRVELHGEKFYNSRDELLREAS